jgi:hypothetical protein
LSSFLKVFALIHKVSSALHLEGRPKELRVLWRISRSLGRGSQKRAF